MEINFGFQLTEIAGITLESSPTKTEEEDKKEEEKKDEELKGDESAAKGEFSSMK